MFLARRDYARQELADRLRRKFVQAVQFEALEGVLDELIQERLLSDERFAEQFTRSRMSRGYGPRRICMELKERGVSEETIRSVLAVMDIDWCAYAKAAYLKKYVTEIGDAKEKAKRMRFLQQRGYTAEQVAYALSARQELD